MLEYNNEKLKMELISINSLLYLYSIYKLNLFIMSGGHFDYMQYHISEIADSVDDYINGHPIDEADIDYVIDESFYSQDEENYVRDNKHTLPNRYGFTKETLDEMRRGLRILREAAVYAQRIDWLLSGDDDEEDFKNRLDEELKEIE